MPAKVTLTITPPQHRLIVEALEYLHTDAEACADPKHKGIDPRDRQKAKIKAENLKLLLGDIDA